MSQTSYDSFFVKNGVTFLASSGDTGGVVEWPSSSPNVIAVGGTNLNYSNGTLVSETAWSGSGGGCSSVEPAIAAQTGFVPSSCKNRAAPDVSMDGGGLSPVYVYISGQGGWYAFYGTSLSVQLWAGVTALANAQHGAFGERRVDDAAAELAEERTQQQKRIAVLPVHVFAVHEHVGIGRKGIANAEHDRFEERLPGRIERRPLIEL